MLCQVLQILNPHSAPLSVSYADTVVWQLEKNKIWRPYSITTDWKKNNLSNQFCLAICIITPGMMFSWTKTKGRCFSRGYNDFFKIQILFCQPQSFQPLIVLKNSDGQQKGEKRKKQFERFHDKLQRWCFKFALYFLLRIKWFLWTYNPVWLTF